jgi:flap endonuclease-1
MSIRDYQGKPLKNSNGEITSHLIGLFNRCVKFIELDVKVIFAFDGKPIELKRETIEERAKTRDISLTRDMAKEAKKLVHYLGFPFVNAPSDGEAQATRIVNNEDAWAVASQDYDCFLFGANRVIRNLSLGQTRKVRGRKINVDIEFHKMERILQATSLTRDQIIDIGILTGTDFNKNVKGVGIKTAEKLVRERTIPELIRSDSKFSNWLTIEQYNEIRGVFKDPLVTDDYREKAFKFRKPDIDKVQEFLVEIHGFDADRTNSSLKRLKKVNASKQATMEKFVKKGPKKVQKDPGEKTKDKLVRIRGILD